MQGAHRRLLAHLQTVADAWAPWLVTRSAVRSASGCLASLVNRVSEP